MGKKYVKIIILIGILLGQGVNNTILSQYIEEQYKGQHYVQVDNQWYLFSTADNQLIQTENKIYVKSYDLSHQNIQAIENTFNIRHTDTYLKNFHSFTIDSNHTLLNKMKRLDSLPYIREVECGLYAEYHSIPNDPSYSNGNLQWHLKSTGNGMKVDSAWDITTGDSSILVAVIDNGVDYYHPDLGMGADGYENIYKNRGEDPWISPINPTTKNGRGDSLDTDGNGYVDDWKGWNFYQNFLHGGTKDANWYGGSMADPTNHGTPMAGIIAAKTNNGLGVSGIAGGYGGKGVQILPVNVGPAFSLQQLIEALNYAIAMKADVITMSFGIGNYRQMVVDSIIENAYNNGISFTSSTGNSNTLVQYPANSKFVLGIGAYEIGGQRASYSNYGTEIDLVGPTNFYTTRKNNTYGYSNGTSAATPAVAGVIALMKSVNPCMSTEDIYTIIKRTAVKSGGYNYNWNNSKKGHSKEFGYGRIDAYEAVKMAQGTQSNTLDLYMKDDETDFGLEPNQTTNRFYISPDIWFRNQNDGLTNSEHQNPEYDPIIPVYLNVRIRNKSCMASTGTEKLFVHWTKAGTNLGWPASWNGSTTSPTLGDVIDSMSIPIIEPGRDTVLTIPWVVPDPANYTSVGSNRWHFCLLARIKSMNDPLFTPEVNDLKQNLKNNNNIVLKNVTVVDSMSVAGGSSIRKYSGTIAVGNYENYTKTFHLNFASENAGMNSLTEFADIILEVDDALASKLKRSNTPPVFFEDNKILITENNYRLLNIDFAPKEYSTLNLTFLFKTDRSINQQVFHYFIDQIDVQTNETVGGEQFVVKPSDESVTIDANAGDDKSISSSETITLTAEYISSDVEYKWFDDNGNLVAEGRDLTVNDDVSTTYKLKVFDLKHGITDDDYVNIKVDDHEIKSISPNPSSTNQIEVTYNVDGSTNAYLMIIENGRIRNYIITNTVSKTIQIANYSAGSHSMLLICDGVIKDAKTIIKI